MKKSRGKGKLNWILIKAVIFFVIAVTVFFLFNGSMIIKRIKYPLNYTEYIVKYSNEYSFEGKPLDAHLIAAVIYVESRYKPEASSPKGARGLMQLMPDTAQWGAEKIGMVDYNHDMLYIPDINIKLGCWYISNLLNQFKGDVKLVLAAYNGGSGNVTKWLNNKDYSKDGKKLDYIPFPETRDYVDKVMKTYEIYKQIYPDISE